MISNREISKRVLFITGDLASGKSTYSRHLSDLFKIVVFNKDSIKEILGDSIGFSNRAENIKLSIATIKLLDKIFDQMANVDSNIILEGNFHTEDLKRFDEIAKKYNYQTLTIILEADIEVLYKRYLYRITNEERHKVHLSMPLDEFTVFSNYILKSRNRITYGKSILVDANDFMYFEDESLKNMVSNFFLMKDFK